MSNKTIYGVPRELLPCKCGNAAEHFKFEGANFYGCRVCGKAYGNAEEWNASTTPAALPDRKSAVETFSTYGLGECAGWNACLDAVAETVRLEQAATESWRDAFFKLHDQMAELKAAQPQGEPVAWQHRVTAGPQTGWSLWAPGRGGEYAEHYTVEVRPLYVEQPAPVAQKYDDVLLPFLGMMRKELHANSDKGDRDSWLGMTSGSALEEINHHRDKLWYAVATSNPEAIREHAADVANCAMMVADVCGVLK